MPLALGSLPLLGAAAFLSVLTVLTVAHPHHQGSHSHGHRRILLDDSLEANKARPFGEEAWGALSALRPDALQKVAKAHGMTTSKLKRILENGADQLDMVMLLHGLAACRPLDCLWWWCILV